MMSHSQNSAAHDLNTPSSQETHFILTEKYLNALHAAKVFARPEMKAKCQVPYHAVTAT